MLNISPQQRLIKKFWCWKSNCSLKWCSTSVCQLYPIILVLEVGFCFLTFSFLSIGCKLVSASSWCCCFFYSCSAACLSAIVSLFPIIVDWFPSSIAPAVLLDDNVSHIISVFFTLHIAFCLLVLFHFQCRNVHCFHFLVPATILSNMVCLFPTVHLAPVCWLIFPCCHFCSYYFCIHHCQNAPHWIDFHFWLLLLLLLLFHP